MRTREKSENYKQAYPDELEKKEKRLLERRRKKGEKALEEDDGCTHCCRTTKPESLDELDPTPLGVALSGGGIRSATFCLGIFQGLARYKLVRRIDYLSTVSGGGYFSAFLGRLFTREYIHNPEDVENTLLGKELTSSLQNSERGNSGSFFSRLWSWKHARISEGVKKTFQSEEKEINPDSQPRGNRPVDSPQTPPSPGAVFRWLRENGRYLSPNGAGDLILGSAVLMRNWVAIHAVLLTFVLMGFLLAQLVRHGVEVFLANKALRDSLGSIPANFPLDDSIKGFIKNVWDSLHSILAHMPGEGTLLWWSPYILLVLLIFAVWVVPIAWSYWLLIRDFGAHWKKQRGYQILGMAITVAVLVLGLLFLFEEYQYTRLVALGLLLTGLLTLMGTAVALYKARRKSRQKGLASGELPELNNQNSLFKDNFARHWISQQLKTAMVFMGAVLAFALIDSLGQTIYLLLVSPADSALDTWLSGIFAAFIGLAVAARKLAVVFGGEPDDRRPSLPVSILATVAAVIIVISVLTAVDAFSHAIAWEFKLPPNAPENLWKRADIDELTVAPIPEGSRSEISDLSVLFGVWFLLLILSGLFGQSQPFLNWSTHHPLYSARLTRAYLGASNRKRLNSLDEAVAHVTPDDDIRLENYWPAVLKKRGPIHLLSVTINETRDGRSQLQQQDRRGVGMALGPAAVSAGVRHHAIFCTKKHATSLNRWVKIYPDEKEAYRVFEYEDDVFRGECLSLGRWASISGAAFSTGLGSRTSLGLSLLTGLGNIRLGYWWHSGIKKRLPDKSSLARKLTVKVFRTQFYLLYEFLARFSGTAHPDWYLSDGGHFENTGGYELIRRRLKKIVIIDAEADPDYTFEGLANLVRKARLDFQAEIRFLNEDKLDEHLDDKIRPYFGTLDQLRRGRWTEEPIPEPNVLKQLRNRLSIDPVDPMRLARAHAALAEIYYEGETKPTSWLLYIKPTLMGDEPSDVLQYHASHSRFPQEPTSDQFFDEAQWESYRRLGEHIADKLFQSRPAGAPRKASNKHFMTELLGFL